MTVKRKELKKISKRLIQRPGEAYSQWIEGFFNRFASTAHAIAAKVLLKYPSITFVKAKS